MVFHVLHLQFAMVKQNQTVAVKMKLVYCNTFGRILFTVKLFEVNFSEKFKVFWFENI